MFTENTMIVYLANLHDEQNSNLEDKTVVVYKVASGS